MFENLRQAFREAIDNFKDELSRDEVPETVDKLLLGMRDEVADAKVRVKELEDQIARTATAAAHAKTEAVTCRRRESLAADIDDEETARIAREFAEKHEEHLRVLEQKAVALKQELDFQKGEVAEMMEKFKEAKAKRDALAATAGRPGARDSIRAADDLFAELDRMAKKIGDEDARARAAEAFSEEYDPLKIDLDAPPRPEPDVDGRLEELKRRMGRQE